MVRLTDRAHEAVAAVLGPGDVAIDATMGNGYDTLFLARHVGSSGWVFAFDIQAQALAAVRTVLEEAGLSERVTLLLAGHESMAERVPAELHGRVKAVMFNLGYLPGSDKRITTRIETTLKALEASTRLLAPGGVVSLLAYTGHPGGREEADAVRQWLARLGSDWQLREVLADRPNAPELLLLSRQR